jgi:hypothetical protein
MILSFKQEVTWKAEEVRTSPTIRAQHGARTRGNRSWVGVVYEAVLEMRKLRAIVRLEWKCESPFRRSWRFQERAELERGRVGRYHTGDWSNLKVTNQAE